MSPRVSRFPWTGAAAGGGHGHAQVEHAHQAECGGVVVVHARGEPARSGPAELAGVPVEADCQESVGAGTGGAAGIRPNLRVRRYNVLGSSGTSTASSRSTANGTNCRTASWVDARTTGAATPSW